MSLPRYKEYKDSGAKLGGQIPAHWAVGPIKRMLDIQNGADHKAVESTEGVPVIGSGGPFTFATDFLYDGESVLLGRKGTIDKPLHVTGKFWTVDTMYWSKILPGTCGRFAYYVTLTMPFDYYSTSTALPSMTKSVLGSHIVPCPPIDEQRAIAAFLDRETAKIDTLVSEQEKLIALLAEKRQAAISHAVTKGLYSKSPMKDSGLAWTGTVPAHWGIFRLGSLFRDIDEPGSEALPILSVSIHNGVSDKELGESELDRKVSRSSDRSKYKAVRPGDLTYNMMRAWQGGFGSVTVDGMVSPAYVVARPMADFLTTHVECILRTPQVVAEMKRHSRGITDFRLRLYWEEFKTIQIALPPKAEQLEIAKFIENETRKLDSLKTEAERAISLLKERRNALIGAAVTGQIDVRSAAPQVAVKCSEAIAA